MTASAVSLEKYIGVDIMLSPEHPLVWMGNSLGLWRSFPKEVQHSGGYQLARVQMGMEPKNWKPFPSIGPGVREIRIWDQAKRTFRILYVAKFRDKIHVLHVFEKKTRATRKHDIEIARGRYQALRGPSQ